jgi:hypothetical protein
LFTATLDIHLLGPVHQDVADGRVLEEDFERPEAEGLVENFFDELFAFDPVQQRVFGVAEVLDDASDVPAHAVGAEIFDAGEVESFDEFAVDDAFEIFEVLAAAGGAAEAGAGEARESGEARIAARALIAQAVELRDALLQPRHIDSSGCAVNGVPTACRLRLPLAEEAPAALARGGGDGRRAGGPPGERLRQA